MCINQDMDLINDHEPLGKKTFQTAIKMVTIPVFTITVRTQGTKKMASMCIKHDVTGQQMFTCPSPSMPIILVYKYMYGLKRFRFAQTLNCDGK